MRVKNAIIMAAGTSSRFAPLSYEKHKGLTVVHGEVLIERQVRQLLEAGVPEVYIITGYKAEQFDYLVGKYGVHLLHNPSYQVRNNNGSIWVAREVLSDSFLCSADNYFAENPFEAEVDHAYYAAFYAAGPTNEWCITTDGTGLITDVVVGGHDSWCMMGHTFWDKEFADRFLDILEREYDLPETPAKLWETIYIDHIDELKMWIRTYDDGVVNEFDTLDDLREFDPAYLGDTGSPIMRELAEALGVEQRDIFDIKPTKHGSTEADGFEFDCRGKRHAYRYGEGLLA